MSAGARPDQPPYGEIVQFPCRQNNYGYLLADPLTGRAVAIDTPDAPALMAILEERDWQLTYILNTHWHEDHCGGNAWLKEMTGARVIAPAAERDKIPTTDIAIRDGAVILLGSLTIRAIETAGHTAGHLSYYVPGLGAVFTGDALFTMGCGRLFEGTAETAWQGLERLAALPDDTRIYCAHEYGDGNAAFAAACIGDQEVMARAAAIRLHHSRGKPTVPSTIGLERRTNPFLSLPLAARRENKGVEAECFASLRLMKDGF